MRLSKSRLVRVVLVLAAASSFGGMLSGTAGAQSPGVTQWMVDHNTFTQPNPYPYVTVEEGDDFCKKTSPGGLSYLETATVNALKMGKAVVSEMPIDNVCGYSIATDENLIGSLINYVEANGPYASQKWLGVMLDEESKYGITPANLVTLNASVISKMSATPGVSFVFNEVFEGWGDWTQAQYNSVISGMWAAPQVSTSHMVGYVNASGAASNLVTWSVSYPSPYNNQATSVNAINGAPYYACPYVSGTGCAYMSNEYNNA